MIHQAILDRDILIATYHGRVREMCFYVVGKKNGIVQALFYQFGGESRSGLDSKDHGTIGAVCESMNSRMFP